MKLYRLPPRFTVPPTFGMPDIIRIAALIAATCLASKIEDILKELSDNNSAPHRRSGEEIKYSKED